MDENVNYLVFQTFSIENLNKFIEDDKEEKRDEGKNGIFSLMNLNKLV